MFGVRSRTGIVTLAALGFLAAPLAVATSAVAATPRDTISVSLPAFVAGSTDGLPSVLAKAGAYTAVVHGMPTAGSGSATMSLTVSGATVAKCSTTVGETQLATLRCSIKVGANATKVKIGVRAKGATFNKQFASFTHVVK